MYLFSREENRVAIEWDGCGKIYMFNNRYFSSISKTGCINNALIQCPNCGRTAQPHSKIEAKEGSFLGDSNNGVKCPHCGSTQITASNKGFGVGKAAAGAILFGAVGLVGGMIGSKKTIITCLKCGKKWEAGKM